MPGRASTPVQVSPATRYAIEVAEGRIVTGWMVRKACERHISDLARQNTPDFPYYFDEDREQHFHAFVRFVRLAEGQPFLLDGWQQFVGGVIFGWVDGNGNRRFRTSYIEIGKGNGKTPFAGLIGLYGLIADGEDKPEVYAAGVTRDQGDYLFKDAKLMAEGSPDIKARLDILEHNIAYRHGFFRAVSSEARSLDNKRVHMALIDEIHEHPTGIVVQKMRAGVKGRLQPLIFEITNSGASRATICWEHHEHSRNVLEGNVTDETWFAYVCTLDPCEACWKEGKRQPDSECPDCDNWRDEAVWQKVNPSVGVIVTWTYLREQVKEATNIPSSANLIKRLNFCIWTEQVKRWLDMEKWDACGGPIDMNALRGEDSYCGLDLATRIDFAAAALWFPRQKTVLMRFWLPSDLRHRTEKDREMIARWVQEGFVKLTEGNITDYDVIREDIIEWTLPYQLRELPFDRWNATQIATQLDNAGITVVPMQQGGDAMSEAAKELDAIVTATAFHHGDNPVLRWMAANVAIREDLQGNIKLDRDSSGDKIDGIVALVMAIARAMVGQDEGEAGVFFT